MNSLPKEKRDHMVMVGLVTLMAVAGLWFGLIRSQANRLASKTKETAKAEAKANDADRFIRRAAQLQDELAAVQGQLEPIERSMVSRDLVTWIYQILLDCQARNPGVTQVEVWKNPAIGDVGLWQPFAYGAVTYTIEFNAYYHDFGRFLMDFEIRHPYFRMENLEIFPARKVNPGEEEKLGFKVNLVALLKPEAPR